ALDALAAPKRAAREGADRGALERIEAAARRLADAAGAARDEPVPATEAGAWLALAFPDRVGLRRKGEQPRYLLANGRGAALAADAALGASRLIVAIDVEDASPDARVRRAAALSEADLRARFGDRVGWQRVAEWSRRERRVIAEEREGLDALVLDRRRWTAAPPDVLARALCEGLAAEGAERLRALLAVPDTASSLIARVEWLRRQGGPLAERLPAMDDATLAAEACDWLAPYLTGERAPGEIAPGVLDAALAARVGDDLAAVERAAPAAYEPPLGGKRLIDYSGETPRLTIRVQELFGETRHPSVGEPPVALVLELTSPAGRPVQTTRDLPGFWASSYAEVAREMRARHPKHPWPDDPAAAPPTRRAKARRS
ncbi:MAG: ATP-dependent helicase C-terminal domain-containing protein, partial [Paracoccaceae bacterium]